MTLTIMFSAPWQWVPFLNICWEDTKVLAMGWGPLQIYLTNYSPIASNNSLHETIYYLLDKDEEKTCQVLNIANIHYDNSATLERLIAEIKK